MNINEGCPEQPFKVETVLFPGMTLRAYFAGQALEGLLVKHGIGIAPGVAAKEGVAYADALLAELAKEEA